MSITYSERCTCGEQYAVEVSGLGMEDLLYLCLHDLVPIESCEGCGRSFAEMREETERWQGLWDEAPYDPDQTDGVRCGGIRYEGRRI